MSAGTRLSYPGDKPCKPLIGLRRIVQLIPMSGAGEAAVEQTDVGSYFVANYPPFSVWNAAAVSRRQAARSTRRADARVPLGLYLHIPFCRKRCHFCYFRVYTDKNAREVEQLSRRCSAREWELLRRAAGGRRPAASTSSTSAAARRRSSRRSSSQGLVGPAERDRRRGTAPKRSRSSASPARSPSAKLAAIRDDGRHAPQPRRRELRRSHPRAERPRAPLAGDRPRLRSRARARASRRSTST